MISLENFWRGIGLRISKTLVPILAKIRLKPDTVTWFALALNIVASVTIATKHLLVSGLLVLLAGLFDILDGALARSTEQTSRFGALLDSTFDRLSEAVLFLGLLVLYIVSFSPRIPVLAPGTEFIIAIVLIFLAMVGSFLTSYVRARAEGIGVECKVGLFTRTERVIILALGLLVNYVLIALLIIVVLSFVTVGQRLVHARRRAQS